MAKNLRGQSNGKRTCDDYFIQYPAIREKPYQTRMLLQVHDELVFNLHVSEQADLIPRILHAMSHALPLPHDVPGSAEAGTGANWLAAH